MKTLTTKNGFKALVGNYPFYALYTKSLGELRIARGQLGILFDPYTGKKLVKNVTSEDQREIENEIGVIRYYDWEKKAYRQFSLENLVQLSINGKVIFERK